MEAENIKLEKENASLRSLVSILNKHEQRVSKIKGPASPGPHNSNVSYQL